MKKMIIGLIALASITSTSFAAILEIDATNDEVRDAIIVSLERSNLKCTVYAGGESAEFVMNYSGLKSYFHGDYELTAQTELPQPTIELIKTDQSDEQISRVILTATTSPDLKKVVKLSWSFHENVQKTRINVGTILNPVFQEGLDNGTPSIQILCE